MKQILTEPQPAKAVFFDRDGVLNRAIVRNGKPYPPQSLADFSITPDAPGSVADLFRAGFRLFVVTNQPDVARGNQTRAAVENMHDALRRELPIEEIFTCWHDDAAGCDCRKPRPGLILTAKAKYESI